MIAIYTAEVTGNTWKECLEDATRAASRFFGDDAQQVTPPRFEGRRNPSRRGVGSGEPTYAVTATFTAEVGEHEVHLY